MKKQILFIVVLAVVIGAIVYLEEPVKEVERVSPVVEKSGTLAPELSGIEGYINTENISLSELVGKKVVLVDIWTYSCINCQRTLPYITAWHNKYKDMGLEVIGVHSPEFDFEKKFENVKRAVDKFGIKYPVVLDNEHSTWNAFRNRYWPAKYLVDIDGYVVWSHFGEGAYDEAEKMIQKLLAERLDRLGMEDGIPVEMSIVEAPSVDFMSIHTPEIYLGFEFTRGNFGNKEGLPPNNEVSYSIPDSILSNSVYLEGNWFVDKDHVRLVGDSGKVLLKYDAKNVNIVASASPGSVITVFVDGKETQKLSVKEDDLYSLVDLDYGRHELLFEIEGSGFKLYTFTFG